jgi:tuberculosinol/isotuberculosinol synthase
MMDVEAFQGLSTAEVAQLVRAHGPKVCVFPINGTRRWFELEYPEQAAEDFGEAYLRVGGQRHIELYRMFFDHGLDTLLTPIFGPDLLARGDAYMRIAAKGLLWFIQDQEFLDFYDAYDVRVRVYGDAHRYFSDTPYAYLLEAFDDISRRTASHRKARLFFGVCAHDATETIAEISVRFHQEHGRLPHKREIVETYYGEYVEPVDLFIGFDRFTVFDMPLIATGDEDLYFTVSPSPYLDPHTLRAILYDFSYARRAEESDYTDLSADDWQILREFYGLNRHSVLGLGRRHSSGGFWYPLPQVNLPSAMAEVE